MQKSRVEITESQLREIIKESVNQVLINEGLLGGVGSLWRAGKDAVRTRYNNFKTNVQNNVHQMKDTYNAGSNYQNAQQLSKQANNTLKQLTDTLNKMGLDGQSDEPLKNISALINSYSQAAEKTYNNYMNPPQQPNNTQSAGNTQSAQNTNNHPNYSQPTPNNRGYAITGNDIEEP